MTERRRPTPDEIERDLRELALIDRIFGLEAKLAEVSVFLNPSREQFDSMERELLGLRQQLDAVRSTRTWRIGNAIVSPARWMLSRGRRR